MKKTVVILAGLALASLSTLNAQSTAGAGAAPAGGLGLRAGETALLAALDTNHDGVIDANEIAAAPTSLATLDKNKDGKLTPEEYMPARGASALVAALDVNHDGTINATELASAPTELKSLDKNHDGKITPDELRGGPAIRMAPGGAAQK